jgi:nitrate/nitrite transport system ATP-binding protein
MLQRVGIARAFAIQPEVLLMDEPFGALDALTRSTVQDELLSLWRDSGSTVFLITHDIDEAVYLADRVLLMSEGPNARLAEQVDIPLPRPRDRASLLKDPTYFQVRARLVDFLYGRNSTNTEGANHGQERHEPGRPRRQEGERVELGQAG